MKKTEELKNLRQKSISELQKDLKESKTKFQDLKKEAVLGKIKDSSKIKKTRKTMARISTVILEKMLASLEEESKLPEKPKASAGLLKKDLLWKQKKEK